MIFFNFDGTGGCESKLKDKEYQSFVLELTPTKKFHLPTKDGSFVVKLMEKFPRMWLLPLNVSQISDIQLIENLALSENCLHSIFDQFHSRQLCEYLESRLSSTWINDPVFIDLDLLDGKTWILDYAKSSKANLQVEHKEFVLEELMKEHFYVTEEKFRLFIGGN